MPMWSHALLAGLLHASLTKAQLAYADNKEPLQQDNPTVSALFPNVSSVQLFSPAFINPESVPAGFANGTEGPTDINILDEFLRSIAQRNSWATYHGEIESEELRPIPYLSLSSPQNSTTKSPKLRIWLQGGVHGTEPGGDQAILALLGKFDHNTTWTESILAKADLIVLPRYNVDGVAYFQRYFASNAEANGDQAQLSVQQARDVKQVVSDFDPHIFLDAHEYTGGGRLGSQGQYRKAQDAQVSHVKNPNINVDIRALGEGLFTESIGAALESHDLRWSAYFTGPGNSDNFVLTEPSSISRPNHNSAGLLQSVSFLVETRGIRLGDQHFQRRVASGLIAAEAIVQTAVDNFDEVYETIENGRRAFAESRDDIIVNDTARRHPAVFDFVDARNGSVVQLPVTFNNNTPPIVDLTRPRPQAYIFSRAFKGVAERLRISGVKVDELEEDFVGTVDVLRVTRAIVADSKNDGVVQTTAETESFRKQVRIPKGGYRVDTRQKNAAFAFVTLEPENRASYVRYNIVPLNERDEYPIFRIP
ncbi:carboxypeptidase 2 [Paramyrothecium foliicola]|nr:carboxypeptidase 2 [Paramyrothecium foliicola]